MISICSRAPVRIDFAGGWTDVALFTEKQTGAVVNASINVYSYVSLKRLQEKQIESKEYGYRHLKTVEDRTIKIYSADFDIYHEAADIKQLEYDGNVDLVKAAIKSMNVDSGVEMVTRSDAPAGSGLGTSAAMGVALISAVSKLNGMALLPYEFAEHASSIERHELNILGGKQDHYASAIGGFHFMEFSGEDVKVSKLQLSSDVLYELEKSLVLCYTGKSRLSGNIHQHVVDAYLEGKEETLDALKNLRDIAVEMKTALLKEDLPTFGRLLNENWENQKRLHPTVTNPQIDELFGCALNNGAAGGKACGAGGGGCVVFYSMPDKEHQVRKSLEKLGVQILPFNFDFTGLQIWDRYDEIAKSRRS